jgi:hypothetical protein
MSNRKRQARDRRRAETGKCGGRRSMRETRPEVVALVKQLHVDGLSYRKIAARLAELGHVTGADTAEREKRAASGNAYITGGKPYSASAIQKMLGM